MAIAGCIPPLGERCSIHIGSICALGMMSELWCNMCQCCSYESGIPSTRDAALEEYRRLAATLGPACNVLLCETMSSVEQATLACTAAQSQGVFGCHHHVACSDSAWNTCME